MKSIKFLFPFILSVICVLSCQGQADSTVQAMPDSAKPAKRPMMLTLGLDLNVSNFSGAYTYDYKGEYNVNGGGAAGWKWVDHKISFDRLMKKTNFMDVKLSVLVANTKTFQAGLSYNFGSVTATIPEPDYGPDGNDAGTVHYTTHNFVYAGISLMTQYNYYFNQKSKMGMYAFGGLDLGFYTGTDDLFGPGTPFYLQGRLGLGYNFNKDIMFKAFLSQDMLIYNETETSQVYQKPETITMNFNAFYFGLGIAKTFSIVPD